MKFEIYHELFGDWYWRARAANNRIIADGAEGYATKANARRAVHRFIKLVDGVVSTAQIVELD